jgi:hypothetical protein
MQSRDLAFSRAKPQTEVPHPSALFALEPALSAVEGAGIPRTRRSKEVETLKL